MLSFSRLYSTSAVGYTDQSVVQTSFSSLTLVFKLQLSLRFQLICVQCVWVLTFWKVTIFQYASTLVNQRLHFDVFLPTSSRVCKVSIFQLRYSPFFLLGLFWGLPRSHRLSSHSRLNAFVIQTKLNLSQNNNKLIRPFSTASARTVSSRSSVQTTCFSHNTILLRYISTQNAAKGVTLMEQKRERERERERDREREYKARNLLRLK